MTNQEAWEAALPPGLRSNSVAIMSRDGSAGALYGALLRDQEAKVRNAWPARFFHRPLRMPKPPSLRATLAILCLANVYPWAERLAPVVLRLRFPRLWRALNQPE